MEINITQLENLGYSVEHQTLDNGENVLQILGNYAPSEHVRDGFRMICDSRAYTDQEKESLFGMLLNGMVKLDVNRAFS